MASALIGGFIKSKAVPVSSISVSEPFEPLRKKHAAAGLHAISSNLEVAKRSKVLWLAVKPDVVPDVLREIGPTVRDSSCLVVSIAAGITIGQLEGALPAGCRVVRVMPNLAQLAGEGAAGFACGTHASRADSELVKRLLSTVGHAEEVPEKQLDAVTGLSGSGPAYGFLMIEALADGGVRAGLPRPVALALAAQTLKGAAAMVQATGKHPAELKDMVCSPGGTTIAGVEALERRGFRGAAMDAVAAASARSAQLRQASKL